MDLLPQMHLKVMQNVGILKIQLNGVLIEHFGINK